MHKLSVLSIFMIYAFCCKSQTSNSKIFCKTGQERSVFQLISEEYTVTLKFLKSDRFIMTLTNSHFIKYYSHGHRILMGDTTILLFNSNKLNSKKYRNSYLLNLYDMTLVLKDQCLAIFSKNPFNKRE